MWPLSPGDQVLHTLPRAYLEIGRVIPRGRTCGDQAAITAGARHSTA